MKKILGIIITSILLVASVFSLELSVGGRGAVGGNLGNKDSDNDGLSYGGGIYANLDLLKGFGLQGEINLVNNSITTGDHSVTFSPNSCMIIDVPVMPWYNYSLTDFVKVGGGIGVNFSFYSNKDYKAMNDSNVNIGLALGGNIKLSLSRFALVLGVNSVFDFMPTTKIKDSDGSTTVIFGSGTTGRKAVYGTLGIEVRLL